VNQRLQGNVAYDESAKQGNAHHKTGFACLFEKEKDDGQQDPKYSAVTQLGYGRKKPVEKITPYVFLDKIQDAELFHGEYFHGAPPVISD
jgi:hypothetical protein